MGLVNVEVELLRVHADMRAALSKEVWKDEEITIPVGTYRKWMRVLYTCSKDLEADRKRDG